MNVYFLVEGEKTEMEVYPRWLSTLAPNLRRVASPDEADSDCYYLGSGFGYPSILTEFLPEAVETVNELRTYDFLVLVADTDDFSVEERREEIEGFLSKQGLVLWKAELVLILQHCCIETWFLGNRTFFPANPRDERLQRFIAHHNVSSDDPELMAQPEWFPGNRAEFHEMYLDAMFRERFGGRLHTPSYKKEAPRHVQDQSYLEQLKNRVSDESSHLKSFQNFLEFCARLRPEAA